MPVFSDQVVDAGIHDLLVRMSPHPLSLIGDKDIFLLIGYCVTWAEISDFRRTVSQRPIRYASMIVPFRLRGGAESALWTSQTAIDTALTGDPWASSWMVYCAGGIASHQFDISPLNAEIRTLADSYRLVEHECEDDPEGVGGNPLNTPFAMEGDFDYYLVGSTIQPILTYPSLLDRVVVW